MIQKRILILFQISFFVVFFFFVFQIQSSHSQVTSFNIDIDFVSNYLHRGISKSQTILRYNLISNTIFHDQMLILVFGNQILIIMALVLNIDIQSIIPQGLILLITLLVIFTMILKIMLTHLKN